MTPVRYFLIENRAKKAGERDQLSVDSSTFRFFVVSFEGPAFPHRAPDGMSATDNTYVIKGNYFFTVVFFLDNL